MKVPKMINPEVAIDLIDTLDEEDKETAHREVDDILCAVLRHVSSINGIPGYAVIADKFEEMRRRRGFWYA